MIELNPPDPKLFDFIRDGGYKFKGPGGSLLFQSTAVLNSINDKNFRSLAKWTGYYLDNIAAAQNPNATEVLPVAAQGPIFRQTSFKPYTNRFAFKFVSEDTYDQYLSNGNFRVSSLECFRQWEHQGDPAGDRMEGYSHCGYCFGEGQELCIATISGFNCHILSLTRDLKNQNTMRGTFGDVVLRVELKPFAESLADALGAKAYEIRSVKYSDLKLFRGELTPPEINGFPPDLTAEFASAVRDKGRLPSIFIKPKRFKDEREIRLVFQMDDDVAEFTSLNLPHLLRYVERIR
ncbi:MAG: hypothetical protein BGO57_09565 [Sphingomonadales bacterium 63-6]|nr:MAG: hypothetical protein BGO57_09565 [Sphingomonadales bacterium 63-6]